jgi:hypothetical protein
VSSEPLVDRPALPPGYGVELAENFIEWSDVESRLRESLHYWVSTTRPDGGPHVVPRWGVWLDGAFWYDGSPETVHVRNLASNPRCVLHLEDGEKAVIVEGRSIVPAPVAGELGAKLAGEFARKYAPAYEPPPESWSGEGSGGLRSLRPERALAWTRFPTDVTRYTFEP